jgi:hypothetical protein
MFQPPPNNKMGWLKPPSRLGVVLATSYGLFGLSQTTLMANGGRSAILECQMGVAEPPLFGPSVFCPKVDPSHPSFFFEVFFFFFNSMFLIFFNVFSFLVFSYNFLFKKNKKNKINEPYGHVSIF